MPEETKEQKDRIIDVRPLNGNNPPDINNCEHIFKRVFLGLIIGVITMAADVSGRAIAGTKDDIHDVEILMPLILAGAGAIVGTIENCRRNYNTPNNRI